MKPKIAQQWLNILCETLPETQAAIFVTQGGDGQVIQALAKWPDKLDHIADLLETVQYALGKKEQAQVLNIKQAENGHYDYFVLPVRIQTESLGTIVFKFKTLPNERQESILSNLQEGQRWLTLADPREYERQGFYVSVLALQASCLEQTSYRKVLIRLVTEFTQSLNCEQVAVGELVGRHSKIVALSNSAQFDARSNFMQAIADAMDEAVEQDNLIVFPDPQTNLIQRAHRELARKSGSGSLLTIPMVDGGEFFGAVTLLRSEEKPFDAETVRLCKTAIALLSPFLALKKNAEQGLFALFLNTAKKRVADLFSYKYLKTKLVALGISSLIFASALLQGDFHLTADAVLEGKMQRVIAAPIEGFLVSASVRAGDTVRKGDLMASLDDSDLQLELSKLNGQLQKLRREYREALSSHDMVKVRVISAQIDQALAELELTQQQLQKLTLVAPFDGVVIEGDLSQLLGSPVERGDMLFKLAPTEGYRIILKVDERLISFVQAGQKGLLALSSLPDRKFKLTVQKITAVAKAENKKNIFRVEASLDKAPELLRPGMEGIGKINAGRRSLLWIGTHELVDWLRLWVWSWWL